MFFNFLNLFFNTSLRPAPFSFNPENINHQIPQMHQDFPIPHFNFQIPPPFKMKKRIFEYDAPNINNPHCYHKENIPQENHPNPLFFNQMERKTIEPFIPCEFCNKQILFTKFNVHMASHQSNFNISPYPQNQRVEFRPHRGHSTHNQNNQMRIGHEEPRSHNIPQEFEPILHERGPHMRGHPQIFNEGGLREIRNMQIPHHMHLMRRREDPLMRGRHHEKKKNKKFNPRDIDFLFPLVKYQEEKGKSLDEEGNKCSICLMDFIDGESVRYLTCLHRFHQDCIDAWLAKNIVCPVCKKDLVKLVKLGEQISRK